MNIAQMLLLFQLQQMNTSWQTSNMDTSGLYNGGESKSSNSQLFAAIFQAALGSGGNNDLYQTTAVPQKGSESVGSLETIIDSTAQKYGVDPNLVKQVVKAESGYNSKVTSPVGAMGLMQLMPGTAASYGVSNAYDPIQNLDGGTRLLKDLLDRYKGNIPLSLAAYNAGSGAVEKYQGIPPYKETQDYVQKIVAGLSQNDWKV
jgi:soluble lytic murein transglycosylase-like protein